MKDKIYLSHKIGNIKVELTIIDKKHYRIRTYKNEKMISTGIIYASIEEAVNIYKQRIDMIKKEKMNNPSKLTYGEFYTKYLDLVRKYMPNSTMPRDYVIDEAFDSYNKGIDIFSNFISKFKVKGTYKKENPSTLNPKHLKAIKRYENFSQKEVYNQGRINIPIENAIVDGKLVLAKIGTIDTLDYWSDKFQASKKKNLYTHKFKSRSGIYTNPAGNLLIIYPVKMSERGILS